ncbi:MAG: YraN family protein [Gammaproteobacteria bacterium]|nr:YraN family protein [Gammaproteobacteria bacterium]
MGDDAELLAIEHLRQQGLKLLDRNYHSRRGEIDIIMEDAGTLIFIEVKYRQSERFGDAAEMVTPQKQQKIIATALYYLQQHKLDCVCRFDVIAITPNSGIEWIKSAFEAH